MLAVHRFVIRSALRMYLQEQEGVEVISEVSRAGELLRDAPVVQPNLVFLAWDLPDFMPRGYRIHFSADAIHRAHDQMKAIVISSLHQLESKPDVVVIGSQQEERLPALSAKADAFLYQGESSVKVLSILRNFQKNE